MLLQDCTWPPPEPGQEGHCWAKDPSEFRLYRAREFGGVNGAADMKKEIYQRGPIGESI